MFGKSKLLLAAALGLLLSVAVVGCNTAPAASGAPPGLSASATSTTASPQRTFDLALLEATRIVSEVTKAVTAAMRADVLKGNDSDNAIKALELARNSIEAAKVTARSSPSQGVTQINLATASLTVLQAFLAFRGAT